MPEVLEVQIQDKTPASAGGPPRAPGAPGSGSSAGAPGAPGVSTSSGAKGSGDFPLEEYSETIERLHTGVDKVADQITSAFDKIKTRLSGGKESPKAPQAPQASGTPKAPSAPSMPEAPASGETPKAPPAPSAATEASGGAEGVAAAGEAEGAAGAEAVGGLIEGLGALDAATAGLATPFVVLAAVVGVGAVAAVEAFKFGMHIATDRVELFGLKISSAVDELAKFSPAVAQAQALGSVQSMLDDLQEANQTGDDLARLVDAQNDMQHELRELFLPIKKVVTEVMADVMETLAEWLKDARVLFSPEFWQVLLENVVKAAKPEWMGGITVEEAGKAIFGEIKKLREEMTKEKPGEVLFLDQLFANKVGDQLIQRAADRLAGRDPAGGVRFPLLDQGR